MKSKLTTYELASDVSSQLNMLRQDIAAITVYLDQFTTMHSEGISSEHLRRVYRQINSALDYTKTLYNEYHSLACETINDAPNPLDKSKWTTGQSYTPYTVCIYCNSDMVSTTYDEGKYGCDGCGSTFTIKE